MNRQTRNFIWGFVIMISSFILLGDYHSKIKQNILLEWYDYIFIVLGLICMANSFDRIYKSLDND